MTIYGWDLSHYDGPDSRRAVGEGFSFFTHKAGGDALDTELGPWWSLMKGYRASVLLGAYWVLYPGSPAARANEFVARLDSQCPGWRDGPFILQVDCERWGGDQGTVPGKADIKAFCDRLRYLAPKLVPVVYAPKWVYGDSLSGLGYPLWASNYVTGSGSASKLYPGDGSSRWDSYSGQVPLILQFTSSATIAGQTTCDANAYRGTLAQLTAKLAPGWAQEDEEAMAFIDTQAKFNDALDTYFAAQAKDSKNPVGGCVTGHVVGNAASTVGLLLQVSTNNTTAALPQLAAIAKGVALENAETEATAEEITAAFMASLGSIGAEDAAAALVAVLGPEKARAVADAVARG
jgi:hypothetical protein